MTHRYTENGLNEYIKKIPQESFQNIFNCLISLAKESPMVYKLADIPESVLYNIIPSGIVYEFIFY